MSAGTSVIVEIGSQDPAQARFVQDEHVVQAFSPYRPDQPLDIPVLPRRARSAKNFLNAQPCGCSPEYFSVITGSFSETSGLCRTRGVLGSITRLSES